MLGLLGADHGLLLAEDGAQLVHLLDVHLRGVDLARGRPVHVPEGPLLTVQDLPLLLVSLLCHLEHKNNYQPQVSMCNKHKQYADVNWKAILMNKDIIQVDRANSQTSINIIFYWLLNLKSLLRFIFAQVQKLSCILHLCSHVHVETLSTGKVYC